MVASQSCQIIFETVGLFVFALRVLCRILGVSVVNAWLHECFVAFFLTPLQACVRVVVLLSQMYHNCSRWFGCMGVVVVVIIVFGDFSINSSGFGPTRTDRILYSSISRSLLQWCFQSTLPAHSCLVIILIQLEFPIANSFVRFGPRCFQFLAQHFNVVPLWARYETPFMSPLRWRSPSVGQVWQIVSFSLLARTL